MTEAKPPSKLRYYGIALNEKGKRVAFVVRDKDKVPDTALEVHETDVPEQANDKALGLLSVLAVPSYASMVDDDFEDELTPGTVTWHNDDRGCHMALVLEVSKGFCKALFFTSSSNWNRQTRRATKDELALAGFISKKRTFLAPVLRAVDEFSSRRISFPSHRVSSLFREFFGVREALKGD